MTDYVKSTNFASKDSLVTGNPLKIVKGTEIDTEFNNIATAIATKAELNGPSFIGVPTAPTASPGTSSNQLATTAFVQAALQACYPVGSIYTNATNSANPATMLGFGTWTAFGAGRVPVGFDSTNSNFNAAEKTGGSADAIVVSHTHSATVTDPGHSHIYNQDNVIGVSQGGSNIYGLSQIATSTSVSTTGITVSNSTTGSSGTNANLQPYITVYMWKRTA